MTSRSVSATGAGVPEPSATNRANPATTTPVPARIRSTPAALATVIQGSGSGERISQPETHPGPSPATTPGAARKKTALPIAAVVLRMTHPPISSHDDLGVIGPSRRENRTRRKAGAVLFTRTQLLEAVD